MDMAHIIHRVATDNEFATRFLEDAEGTISAGEWVLSGEEIELLRVVLADKERCERLRTASVTLGEASPWYQVRTT